MLGGGKACLRHLEFGCEALPRHEAWWAGLTGGLHPGPGPGALHLAAIAIHTPAVACAAVALGGRVLPMLITLGDKQAKQPWTLWVRRPKDVFTLLLAPGFLHLCREKSEERPSVVWSVPSHGSPCT